MGEIVSQRRNGALPGRQGTCSVELEMPKPLTGKKRVPRGAATMKGFIPRLQGLSIR